MPYGKGIFDALMFVQSESERMDLECVNLFGQMAYVEYGFAEEMLAILVHLDVVPEGDGWTMDAFGGIEKDGKDIRPWSHRRQRPRNRRSVCASCAFGQLRSAW